MSWSLVAYIVSDIAQIAIFAKCFSTLNFPLLQYTMNLLLDGIYCRYNYHVHSTRTQYFCCPEAPDLIPLIDYIYCRVVLTLYTQDGKGNVLVLNIGHKSVFSMFLKGIFLHLSCSQWRNQTSNWLSSLSAVSRVYRVFWLSHSPSSGDGACDIRLFDMSIHDFI